MMAIVITRLTSMYAPQILNAFTTFAVQNDDPKDGLWKKIQIYAKTNTWILEKQRLDKIHGYKYHLESKMFAAVELHKAKARYVRIKVPSYCSNTDVITKIHVTVNELNTKECCRFCKTILS